MKVGLIIGPCPPRGCGVGDYTRCLAEHLTEKGVEVQLVNDGNWGLLSVFSQRVRLSKLNCDILHIQYPTVAFGTKLGPQALALLRSCVITIHEVTQSHMLRQLALFPFGVRPRHIIFTTACERRFAAKWAPWITPVSSVIPIASNVRAFRQEKAGTLGEIVHFGLIMPKKGIEDVLKLAELVKSVGLPWKIRVVGTPPPRHISYYESLRRLAKALPIVWECDLEEKEIAKRLSSAFVIYLPYPDGASERRTTLKAALVSGAPIITTHGPQTPYRFEGRVRFCSTPEDALEVIRILVQNPEEWAKLARSGGEGADEWEWERIAALHIEMYSHLLNRTHTCTESDGSYFESASRFRCGP